MVQRGGTILFSDLVALGNQANATANLRGKPYRIWPMYWPADHEAGMLNLHFSDTGEAALGALSYRTDLKQFYQFTGANFRQAASWSLYADIQVNDTEAEILALSGQPLGATHFGHDTRTLWTVCETWDALAGAWVNSWVQYVSWWQELARMRQNALFDPTLNEYTPPKNRTDVWRGYLAPPTDHLFIWGPRNTLGGETATRVSFITTQPDTVLKISAGPYGEGRGNTWNRGPLRSTRNGATLTLAFKLETPQEGILESILDESYAPGFAVFYFDNIDLTNQLTYDLIDPHDLVIEHRAVIISEAYMAGTPPELIHGVAKIELKLRKTLGAGEYSVGVLVHNASKYLSDGGFGGGVNLRFSYELPANEPDTGLGDYHGSLHTALPTFICGTNYEIESPINLWGKADDGTWTVKLSNTDYKSDPPAEGFFIGKLWQADGIQPEQFSPGPVLGPVYRILGPYMSDPVTWEASPATFWEAAQMRAVSPANTYRPPRALTARDADYTSSSQDPNYDLQRLVPARNPVAAGSLITEVYARRQNGQAGGSVSATLGCMRNGAFIPLHTMDVSAGEATARIYLLCYTSSWLWYQCAEALDIQAMVIAPNPGGGQWILPAMAFHYNDAAALLAAL